MNTLVTGASSGIGAALAVASARRGHALFLCGRDAARLDAVRHECLASGAPLVETHVLDVTDESATRAWIDACDETHPLDRVFANAGVSTGVECESNVRRTFAVNVNGTLNTVLPAIAAFRKRRAGQILITASIAGYGPLKACPSYSATKSCIKTWGLALRGMLAPEGIRVSVICPGFVRSRMTAGNTCPMPFLLDAPQAAEIILARAERNIGLIAFPAPMRFGAWFLATLPYRVNAALNRLLPKKVI